jgi:catecholate siderophore receptor
MKRGQIVNPTKNGWPPLGLLALASLSPLAPPASAQEAAKELPTVSVQADADKPDGYRATTTRVGKVLQDPHDIPQAITTITNTLMEEQQVGSLKEAMRNVSGLSFNSAEGGRSGDNMNLRGFYTFGDMYLDGIRDTAQYNRETFNYDQIDVLRGAGAMLFGRGQAGGVINQVSKTPLRIEQYKFTGSFGTDNYRELSADLNKPINGSTALRINVVQRDEGSWRANPATGSEPEIHRKGIAFSLGLNLRTDNQFWLNHYVLTTNDNPDYGISFDGTTKRPGTSSPFAPNTFWGTDRTFDKSDTRITTLINELRLSPESQLRTQLRVADYERSYWARTPSLTQAPNAQALVLNGAVANGGPTRISDYETVTLQSDYNTRFQAFGMKHEAIAGIEYLKESSFRNSLRNRGGTTAGNPPWYMPYEENTAATATRFTSDSYAVYAQDTIEFIPKWKATLGMRRDQMDAKYSSATSPKLKFSENSYRAALSFHPTGDTHYYLGWSDSFSPTADLYQLTVRAQPPERSEVVELGAKWLLLDGDLALRAALYQATKDWERNGDLESTAAILTKKRHQGHRAGSRRPRNRALGGVLRPGADGCADPRTRREHQRHHRCRHRLRCALRRAAGAQHAALDDQPVDHLQAHRAMEGRWRRRSQGPSLCIQPDRRLPRGRRRHDLRRQYGPGLCALGCHGHL